MMIIEKTAIVTGGGKRVGAGIVAALVADGWRVVAHVHDGADSVPDGAIKVVADLAAVDCAETIFAAVEGPVGLLVNNAARFAWDGFGEASAHEFDSHMAVNARAPMLLIDALATRHVAGSSALVVNILDAKLAAPCGPEGSISAGAIPLTLIRLPASARAASSVSPAAAYLDKV